MPAEAFLERQAKEMSDRRGPPPGAGGGGGQSRYQGTGRTPNPYAGSGGRTQNPYASASGGKTQNPYLQSGGRTANPLLNGGSTNYGGGTAYFGGGAWDSGSKTPAAGAWGGTTPAFGGSGGDAWDSGSKTPAPGASGGDFGNGYDDGPSSAPTGYNSAPTPAPYGFGGAGPSQSSQQSNWDTPWNAPTNAPTPAAPYGHSAQTPAAPQSAPTPAGQPYSAPTPAASGGFMNPERARQLAERQAQMDDNSAPSPAFEPSYDEPPMRSGRGGPQQSGSNTSTLGNARRWGSGAGAAAPTPYASAATPGGDLGSAPTPGVMSAPTPGALSAPTPGAFGAPTPGAGLGAPTPAASGRSARHSAASAATPYVSNAYTPAAPSGGWDDTSPRHVSSTPNLPWDWPKVGLRVRLVKSAQGESYEEGAFDNREARIESVLADDDTHEVICSISLDHLNRQLEGVPASTNLQPLRPSKSMRCMMLSGPRAGTEVTCEDVQGDETVFKFPNGHTERIASHLLCAVSPSCLPFYRCWASADFSIASNKTDVKF